MNNAFYNMNHAQISHTQEILLKMLDRMLAVYLSIPGVFNLFEVCGLRPAYMLDASHPAYITDAMVAHLLATFDPSEEERTALERCMVEQINHYIKLMEAKDLTEAQMDGARWNLYLLDALLRLVWRRRGSCLHIPFYLEKESGSELSDPFCIEVDGTYVRLTHCTSGRNYEIDTKDMDYSDFYREICRRFRFATEDYGYFVPAVVWISYEKLWKGGDK